MIAAASMWWLSLILEHQMAVILFALAVIAAVAFHLQHGWQGWRDLFTTPLVAEPGSPAEILSYAPRSLSSPASTGFERRHLEATAKVTTCRASVIPISAWRGR